MWCIRLALFSVKQENTRLKESNQWLQEQLMDLRAEMRSLKQTQPQGNTHSHGCSDFHMPQCVLNGSCFLVAMCPGPGMGSCVA